jgi:chromosome segregation ATPase
MARPRTNNKGISNLIQQEANKTIDVNAEVITTTETNIDQIKEVEKIPMTNQENTSSLTEKIDSLTKELATKQETIDNLTKELTIFTNVKQELTEAKQTALDLAEKNTKLTKELEELKHHHHQLFSVDPLIHHHDHKPGAIATDRSIEHENDEENVIINTWLL